MAYKKTAIRGLASLASVIFFAWGALIVLKGVWDVCGGQPEANFFSPQPWEFVTREQWFRYAGFEIIYGVTCLALGWYIRRVGKHLPEWIEREETQEELM